MTSDIIDLTKILILNPTNKELCDLLEKRIKTLDKAISVNEPGGNKARLIDDIDKLSIEIMDRLLMKTGESK